MSLETRLEEATLKQEMYQTEPYVPKGKGHMVEMELQELEQDTTLEEGPCCSKDLSKAVKKETDKDIHPQMQFQAPMENDLMVKTAISNIMKSQVMVSLEEAMAMSPQIQKHLFQQMQSQKVPQMAPVWSTMATIEEILTGAEPVMHTEEHKKPALSRGIITAPEVVRLRDVSIELRDTGF
ncbi:hypothetical protein DACRYDRAFT_108484 [Dacryopinax primogenitus]|uniref:Uncharacterized protein n=1 Tax=Dacryopinax primogenitus (strain DJM 731) TaxID=1858805 RepID=M5GB23_DACPD|nr:uncharacterized protein DACRYDRAFT_108484 [Dacryopinax primogenitus]EJU01153.1 hypothetical protein DACRYDRAFT_108484 [Dacryopinax primogenitus]